MCNVISCVHYAFCRAFRFNITFNVTTKSFSWCKGLSCELLVKFFPSFSSFWSFLFSSIPYISSVSSLLSPSFAVHHIHNFSLTMLFLLSFSLLFYYLIFQSFLCPFFVFLSSFPSPLFTVHYLPNISPIKLFLLFFPTFSFLFISSLSLFSSCPFLVFLSFLFFLRLYSLPAIITTFPLLSFFSFSFPFFTFVISFFSHFRVFQSIYHMSFISFLPSPSLLSITFLIFPLLLLTTPFLSPSAHSLSYCPLLSPFLSF